MKVTARIMEIILGLIFLGAGINGYFVLFGLEPFAPTSPAAMEFLGDGYLLALEKGIEIVAGIMLIIRRYIPLILVVLAGIVINILAFHLFVDAELLVLAIVLVVLEGFLAWYYRESYKGLLVSRPEGK
ncbi:hypothetical protein [Ornithinibacillus scapharcae]|uniref:hypothetical protein n=1 Tax=Ornithinibacillus scapharcae TaxID=1147159 RepID=UPI000225B2CC|nr:hypothetical protein [Ornithinibacillus scapharcae]